MGKIIYLQNNDSQAKQLIDELLEDVDDYELLIFVGVKKDNDIFLGHTAGSSLEKAGLMTYATNNFIGECYE